MSASPVRDSHLSSPRKGDPFTSRFSPPHPICKGTSLYPNSVPQRYKYKTLIFGGVFETSERLRVEREPVVFKVGAAAAAAALSHWH